MHKVNRIRFSIALLGWWWFGRAQAQTAVYFGEIRDTLISQTGTKFSVNSVAFAAKGSKVISNRPYRNSELFLPVKFITGRPLLDSGRGNIYLENKWAEASYKDHSQLILSQDVRSFRISYLKSGLLVQSWDVSWIGTALSERRYTAEVGSAFHSFQTEVERQALSPPAIEPFISHLKYSTELWAGAIGVQTKEIFTFNSLEYLRVSAPLVLNQKRFRSSAQIGYGLADKAWKSKVDYVRRVGAWFLGGVAKKEIEESNNYFYSRPVLPMAQTRNLFINRFDLISAAAAEIGRPSWYLNTQVGYQSRSYRTGAPTFNGSFFAVNWDIPIQGAESVLENGHVQNIELSHFFRLNAYGLVGKSQKMLLVKPQYFFANAKTAWVQVSILVNSVFQIGHVSPLFRPVVEGNGVDFNTVTTAALETLIPGAMAAKSTSGIYFSLEKHLLFASESPFQPSPFITVNSVQVRDGYRLSRTQESNIGNVWITELGVGVKNLFVFPLPSLCPSVGLGYFIGFYPSGLADLQSGGLKFTLRFFY